jgi:hypothetical protein
MTSATAYAIQATVHGMTKHGPSQLVYQKDMILQPTIEADLAVIRQQRDVQLKQTTLEETKDILLLIDTEKEIKY